MKIAFTESTRSYRGHGYRFSEPGEYEVDDATAKRLLKDFPQWFEAVNDNTEEEEKPSINLSKANRAQLEAVAAEIGLEVTAELDTNKKLKEAIEAKQKEA